jgi:hypothetical protein
VNSRGRCKNGEEALIVAHGEGRFLRFECVSEGLGFCSIGGTLMGETNQR